MIKSIQDAIATRGTIKRFGYQGANIIDFVDQKYKDEITQEIKEGYLKDLQSEINTDGSK
jgi:tetrahydromethanopterin S-methyltransferase subunit A